MKTSYRSRLISALVALIAMATMQFAMATRVCPVPVVALASGTVAMSMDNGGQALSVPDCLQTETAQPGLCFAYSQVDSSSIENAAFTPVQPLIVAPRPLVSGYAVAVYRPAATPPQYDWLRHPIAASLAIQHCSF
ncbi:MAG: hypothetical protein ABI081_08115, partial [Burkholderiaceae bacterium]